MNLRSTGLAGAGDGFLSRSRRTISRPSRRCSAPSSSTTRPSTASPTSSSRCISTSRSTGRSTRSPREHHPRRTRWRRRSRSRPSWAAELAIGDMNLAQYLARLAAGGGRPSSMPSDYGRAIHDLAPAPPADRHRRGCRQHRLSAQPIDMPPKGADRGCRAAALRARRDRRSAVAASTPSSDALTTAIDMAVRRLQARRPPRPASPPASSISTRQNGRSAALRPHRPRRPPGDGQVLARYHHRASMSPRPIAAKRSRTAATEDRSNGGRRRLLLARNVGRAARHPHHRRAVRRVLVDKIRRGSIDETSSQAHRHRLARNGSASVLYRPDRRPHRSRSCCAPRAAA